MKIRSCGAIGAATVATAASMIATSGAHADFIGWTSTVRSRVGTTTVNGFQAGASSYLINVFAVTDNSLDGLASVSGSGGFQPGQGGSITTNASGGFRQGTGNNSVFAPNGAQAWTTLDSFLTVGGSVNTSNGLWFGNGSTSGDPPWNVTYFDDLVGSDVTVSAFNTQSNDSGFTNNYTSGIPIDIATTDTNTGQTVYATGGWKIEGTTSAAISLSLLPSAARVAFGTSGGINYGSSSAAAAAGTHGFMVAQFWVTEWGGFGAGAKFIDFKMSANVKRPDGSNSSGLIGFRIGEVPAPGALALLGLAGAASRRRRSA